MFTCPHCREHLHRLEGKTGVQWRCPACEGRAVTVPQLRRMMDGDYVNQLWRSARDTPVTGNLGCPLCHNPMRVVENLTTEGEGGEGIKVDVCTTCHSVWFDTHEIDSLLEHVALPETKSGETELSPKAREVLAMARIESIRTRADADDMIGGEPPAEGWKTILTVFGFPVEEDVPELTRFPLVTWSVFALMVLATTWAALGEYKVLDPWGLIPIDPLRYGGLTFVTSFFLHAGALHLLGNAVFLLLFGDNVEDYLGHWKYALLLIGASVAADLTHMMTDPRAEVALVGASGGISGIIAYYALRFPKARLVYFVRVFLYFQWVRFSAMTGFFLWMGLQFLGAWKQLAGFSNVSAMAHLGGAVFGFVWWFCCLLYTSPSPRDS